jgi:hypothetical protein
VVVVALLPRDYVDVDMWHGLAGVDPILDSDVER